jgi:hypothetical protein
MDKAIIIALIGAMSAVIGSVSALLIKNYLEKKNSRLILRRDMKNSFRTSLIEAATIVQKIKDTIRFSLLSQTNEYEENIKKLFAEIDELLNYYAREHANISSLSIRKGIHSIKNQGAKLVKLNPSHELNNEILNGFLQSISNLHLDILSSIVNINFSITNDVELKDLK